MSVNSERADIWIAAVYDLVMQNYGPAHIIDSDLFRSGASVEAKYAEFMASPPSASKDRILAQMVTRTLEGKPNDEG